jgi:hypothetical protein
LVALLLLSRADIGPLDRRRWLSKRDQKIAKEMGITVPTSLLLRADEIIE